MAFVLEGQLVKFVPSPADALEVTVTLKVRLGHVGDYTQLARFYKQPAAITLNSEQLDLPFINDGQLGLPLDGAGDSADTVNLAESYTDRPCSSCGNMVTVPVEDAEDVLCPSCQLLLAERSGDGKRRRKLEAV